MSELVNFQFPFTLVKALSARTRVKVRYHDLSNRLLSSGQTSLSKHSIHTSGKTKKVFSFLDKYSACVVHAADRSTNYCCVLPLVARNDNNNNYNNNNNYDNSNNNNDNQKLFIIRITILKTNSRI